MVQKRFHLLIFLLFLFTVSCREALPAPQSLDENLPSSLAELSYCNEDDSGLCLEGFGKEKDEKLIILLQDNNRLITRLQVQEEGKSSQYDFKCAYPENFPQYIYCVGDFIENGALIQLSVYDVAGKLSAQGKFAIQQGDLSSFVGDIAVEPVLTPTAIPTKDIDDENSENLPSPNYPNYPNYPSYPN